MADDRDGGAEIPAVFDGGVPDAYDEFLVPLIFEHYADDIAARLSNMNSGELLEIAAGTGVVTRAMARALPSSVAITATDLSPAMVERAESVGTARPVTWRTADAMQLPFADDSFDAVVCEFGVMFFPSKPDAFAEVRRVLRPGGRFLFNVWGTLEENEFAAAVVAAIRGLYPNDPVPFLARIPYSYNDVAVITGHLHAGGFTAAPLVDRVVARSRASKARDVALGLCHGTLARGEIELHGPDALEHATTLVADAVATQFGVDDLDASMAAIVFEVRA
jgi:ubiquinone/menaquinone biosynthesis C-methylase UbiE